MENSNELKSFHIDLNYCSPSGEKSVKKFKVSIGKVIDISEKEHFTSVYIGRISRKYKVSFSIKMPDEMFSFLNGKEVPSRNDNKHCVILSDLKKTLSGYSLETIIDRYNYYLDSVIWLTNIETMNLNKFIFYSLETNSTENDLGLKSISFKFKYFIGYKNDDSNIIFNLKKRPISKNFDGSDYYRMLMVRHTDEREDFFLRVYNNIEDANELLSKLKEWLFEDNIDNCIGNNAFKLLS